MLCVECGDTKFVFHVYKKNILGFGRHRHTGGHILAALDIWKDETDTEMHLFPCPKRTG